MGARIGFLVVVVVGALASTTAGSAQDVGFCAQVDHVAGTLLNRGVTGANKVFDVQPGGTWCVYGGTHGAYVEKLPHTSSSAFTANEKGAKPVVGLSVPAYSSTNSLGYNLLAMLKGSTEIIIGSKATVAVEKTVAKKILALVH